MDMENSTREDTIRCPSKSSCQHQSIPVLRYHVSIDSFFSVTLTTTQGPVRVKVTDGAPFRYLLSHSPLHKYNTAGFGTSLCLDLELPYG